MLIEKVRKFGYSSYNPPVKNSHKIENGIGAKVPVWLGKEITRLAAKFDILDGTGKPMAFTTTDLMEHNQDLHTTRVAAYLDKKSARTVLCQISLLARLKSLFRKSNEPTLLEQISQAITNSKKLEEAWDKRPSWWDDSSVDHTYLLLKGLNENGFLGVLYETKGFHIVSISLCCAPS